MNPALHFSTATALVELIRGRQVSPAEVLDAVLDRIQAVDAEVHAFVTLDIERARADARRAGAAVMRREEIGLLHGIPVSIKDLEPTAGLRTTYGSKFFEANVPKVDSIVTERLRKAGAIVIGKTNTPAWGHKDMTDNLLMPATRNPWDLSRTSGGSSGGAAAAVASGMGPIAHGTDGAGSIRVPAALCGIFGLRPSYGRVPSWPSNDLFRARSMAGPMARTVDDAALMLAAIAGGDARDPLSNGAEPDDYVSSLTAPLGELRVAWMPTFHGFPLSADVAEATSSAVTVFEDLGCRVDLVEAEWEDPTPWHNCLHWAGLSHSHAESASEHPEWMDASLLEIIQRGAQVTKAEYLSALEARTAFYEQVRMQLAPYDLIASPVLPCGAWSYDKANDAVDGKPIPAFPGARWPFTLTFSLLGWPAASVPCGFTSNGLPIGLQLVAPWHQDTTVLRAAKAFEGARPWTHVGPPRGLASIAQAGTGSMAPQTSPS